MFHRELEVIWPLDRRYYLSACADPVALAGRRRQRRSRPDPDAVFVALGSELATFHEIAQRLSAADDGDKGKISRAHPACTGGRPPSLVVLSSYPVNEWAVRPRTVVRRSMTSLVRIIEKPELSDAELNDLFCASWASHNTRTFASVLRRSLTYFGAFQESMLVGFVNVAWDGGDYAFLLDPTVRPAHRRRGIGLALVAAAVKASAASGAEWLHVDYERGLDHFYRRAGFRPTQSGLIRLVGASDE